MKFVSVLSMCLSFVASKNLLLIPKQHTRESSFLNVDTFAEEHNIETLATFEDITVYKIEQNEFNTYSHTLRYLFDVEEDKVVSIDNQVVFVSDPSNDELTMEAVAPWHLDRITKKKLPLNGAYPYFEKGSCHKNKDVVIETYVVDTGIDITHPQFEGRAVWGGNFVDNKNTDCNSHGTHCAGLVGSKDYGSCRDAKLIAVKVLDCNGSGSMSGVIKGIEFAYKRHLQRQTETGGKVRSVATMSLGGGYSQALNQVVQNCVRNSNSFYFTAAAGNENQDACNTSPASVREILTVMASDKSDSKASFSNYGKCTDIYSPGVDILSTIPNGKTAVFSGSSMSTPLVAGVLNHYLDRFPGYNMKQIKEKMLSEAPKDLIKNNPGSTNNQFVYLSR